MVKNKNRKFKTTLHNMTNKTNFLIQFDQILDVITHKQLLTKIY